MERARIKPRYLGVLIPIAAFTIAAYLVYRALHDVEIQDVIAALHGISGDHVALALVFTAGSFLALSGFDALAVRYTHHSFPYRNIALASFVSLSIGHVLGFAAFSSGALRYRYYTRWGLSAGDVGRIVVFCGVTVTLGMLSVGGAASVARSGLLGELFAIPVPLILGAGIALLLLVAVYLVLAASLRRPLRIRRFELPVPSLGLALGQVALGAADVLLVSAVLHQVLSASIEIDYGATAAVYVTANVAGVLAHVPGGLGVIEAVVISLVPQAPVVAALIAFRALYYLVPFALGCLVLAAAEIGFGTVNTLLPRRHFRE